MTRVGSAIVRAGWATLAAMKNAVVSDAIRPHKVRLGPARGAVLFTSYRHGARQLFGLYERELNGYVRRYASRGACCFDIGAAGGYFTLAFAGLNAPCVVHSFELDARAAKTLRDTVASNPGLGSEIHVHNEGIGGVSDDRRNQVSIDDLVYARGLPAPAIVKMDVEGAEADILRGATRVLRDVHPKWIIEVHSEALERECAEILSAAGYAPTIVQNDPLTGEWAFRRTFNRWICAE